MRDPSVLAGSAFLYPTRFRFRAAIFPMISASPSSSAQRFAEETSPRYRSTMTCILSLPLAFMRGNIREGGVC